MEQIKLGEDVQLLELGNTIQIAGLVFSGQGKSFVATLPHKHDDINTPLKHLQLNKEEMESLLRQLDILEVEMFSSDPTGLLKQIVRKSQRQIDNAIQWAVFKRDNYTCRYCGRDGVPLSVDHIDLWEDGGASVEENLLTACKRCNRDRGSISYKDWIESRHYQNLSKNLPQEIKNKNMMVVVSIPKLVSLRVINKRSR